MPRNTGVTDADEYANRERRERHEKDARAAKVEAEARRITEGRKAAPTAEEIEDHRALLDAVAEARREQVEAEGVYDAAGKPENAHNRAVRLRAEAHRYGLLARKFDDVSQRNAAAAAGIVVGREDEALPSDEWKRLSRQADAAVIHDTRAREFVKLQKRAKKAAKKAAKVAVINEPRVYSMDSPHSYYRDQAVLLGGGGLTGLPSFTGRSPDNSTAEERMNRYGDELAYEVKRGKKEGKRALRIIREQCRSDDPIVHERVFKERRALTTGGGATASASGGGAAAFVSPYFIVAEWAPFRGIARSFADQCHAYPLPDYGMEMYIPVMSGTTLVTAQTEGAAVSETDPTTTLVSAQLQTVTGQVTISQQLQDRGFTGGGIMDSVIGHQIHTQLDQALDLYVLNQVIAGGTSVSDATVPAAATFVPNLYKDIALAREVLTDTAGVRLRPTHLFSTSDLYSYVTRQFDNATAPGRPIVTPQFAPGMPLVTGADDGPQSGQPRPKWSRFTGTIMPGNVLWLEDDNIPVSGSNTQLIVSAPDQAVVVAEGEPILSIFEQTIAGSLEVVVNVRCYVVAITRHAQGSAVITGAAYPTTLL